jgi:hypothetical protein
MTETWGLIKVGAVVLVVCAISYFPVSGDTSFFDNPDDAFIMWTETTLAGANLVGGCGYMWNCTQWKDCFPTGKQERTCHNIGTCPDTYQPPETQQNCTLIGGIPPEEDTITQYTKICTAPLALLGLALAAATTIHLIKQQGTKT